VKQSARATTINKEDGFPAIEIIKQAIERYEERISVSCSFGKDSMVVLHMALQVDPNIKVTFFNTGVEFPETIRFKNQMKKKWNLNLYESKPIKPFWQCVEEYGIPTMRKSGGSIRKGSNAPRCCYYLKERPAILLQRELGIMAILTGLQACESRNRKLLAMRYDNENAPYMERDNISFCSQRWFTRSTNLWSYHPIMLWSVKDVWEYTQNHSIPVNEVYTKWGGIYDRCGCLPCTAYIGWEKKLSKSHPKLYRILKQKQNPPQKSIKKMLYG
jgi:phosphoadenosine phosphosulfate reductase